jgi:hypothetical protein
VDCNVEHQLPLPLFWVQGHFGAFWLIFEDRPCNL